MWYGIVRLILCTARVGARQIKKANKDNKAEDNRPPQPPQQPQVIIVERDADGELQVVNQNGSAPGRVDGIVCDSIEQPAAGENLLGQQNKD